MNQMLKTGVQELTSAYTQAMSSQLMEPPESGWNGIVNKPMIIVHVVYVRQIRPIALTHT